MYINISKGHTVDFSIKIVEINLSTFPHGFFISLHSSLDSLHQTQLRGLLKMKILGPWGQNPWEVESQDPGLKGTQEGQSVSPLDGSREPPSQTGPSAT